MLLGRILDWPTLMIPKMQRIVHFGYFCVYYCSDYRINMLVSLIKTAKDQIRVGINYISSSNRCVKDHVRRDSSIVLTFPPTPRGMERAQQYDRRREGAGIGPEDRVCLFFIAPGSGNNLLSPGSRVQWRHHEHEHVHSRTPVGRYVSKRSAEYNGKRPKYKYWYETQVALSAIMTGASSPNQCHFRYCSEDVPTEPHLRNPYSHYQSPHCSNWNSEWACPMKKSWKRHWAHP